MTEDEKREKYIERLTKHKELSESRDEYAMKRLDVVIIALSSSGLFLIVKYLNDHPEEKTAFYWSIGFLLTAITVNILSQWLGYYANKFESEWAELEMEIEKSEDDQELEGKKQQRDKSGERSKVFSKWTDRTNIIAGLSFVFGVVALFLRFIC